MTEDDELITTMQCAHAASLLFALKQQQPLRTPYRLYTLYTVSHNITMSVSLKASMEIAKLLSQLQGYNLF